MAIDTLPEGFVVDELPEGFQLDTPSNSNRRTEIPIVSGRSRLPVGPAYNGQPQNIGNRISDFGAKTINNFADVGDATRNIVGGAISNPGEAIGNILGGIGKGISDTSTLATHLPWSDASQGVVRPVLNDLLDKVRNSPNKPIDTLLTGASLGAGFEAPVAGRLTAQGLINSATSKVAPLIPKLTPKIYNDALVTDATRSMVSKVDNVIKPIKAEYASHTDPFANKPINSETFQKVLNIVPKEAQKDLAERFGTAILDEKGRPQTNLGNLHSMEQNLQFEISQPKYGKSIDAVSYDFAKAKKQIKEIRLNQYPQQTKDAILKLDEKFGPLINMRENVLPKLSNRAGEIKTTNIFNIMNDARKAGDRDYLSRTLRGLGVDINPELKLIKGWVNRQNQKKFIKGIGGKIVEGATIGGVLKTGL